MKKAKRKFHRRRHEATAFTKAAKQRNSEVVKQVVIVKPQTFPKARGR